MVRKLIEKVKRGLRKLAGISPRVEKKPHPHKGEPVAHPKAGDEKGKSHRSREAAGPHSSRVAESREGTARKVELPGHRSRQPAHRHADEEWVPSKSEPRGSNPIREADQTGAAPRERAPERDAHPREPRRRDSGARGEPHAGRRHESDDSRGPRRERREHTRREDRPSEAHEAMSEPQRVEQIRAAHAAWDPATYQVPPAEGKTRFTELDIAPEVLHAIVDLGFQYCTPIQAAIMPDLLKGRDGLGKAQTGTGKTCAFLAAIFTRLMRVPHSGPPGAPRVVVLAPTRELAMQIDREAAVLGKYTPFRSVAVFGGVDYQKQRNALRDGRADIIVATPGRLIDYLRSGSADLSHVEVVVIDEADRMLDMGFIPDVRMIVRRTPPPGQRQTFFFSATFTGDVRRLADQWTQNAVKVEIEPDHVAAETVDQAVYIASEPEKFAIILNLLRLEMPERVLIFVNRRDTAERLYHELARYHVRSGILSGAIPQDKRMRTLEMFREGRLRVLVATDVAGRGLHVEAISHVINYNLPEDPEDYVHRIGRTGRAGAEGKSISFASPLDAHAIPLIEKFIGRELACTHLEDEWLTLPPMPEPVPGEEGSREGDRGRREGPGPRRFSDSPRQGGGPRRGGPGGRGRGDQRRGPPRRSFTSSDSAPPSAPAPSPEG